MTKTKVKGLKAKNIILGTVDRTIITTLRKRFNLASDSAAIRYALTYTDEDT